MEEGNAERVLRVVDSHVHLAPAHIGNDWVDESLLCGQAGRLRGELDEAAFRADTHKAFTDDFELQSVLKSWLMWSRMELVGAVFVECNNTRPVEEAMWALEQAKSEGSIVRAVIAHVPVPKGAEAVDALLQQFAESNEGRLPAALVGGRVVLLGDPMPPPDACLDDPYHAGLDVLERWGKKDGNKCLVWEICCHHSALPSVSVLAKDHPNLQFVLEHLGRIEGAGGAEDFGSWRKGLEAVSACPNVVAKVGGIELWGVCEAAPLLDIAIALFGFQRILFESNWFINKEMGKPHGATPKEVLLACQRNGATAQEVEAVFAGNAERIYRLK